MTPKREKPLALDLPFPEALKRLIGTKPEELPDNVRLRQKKAPAEARARCCGKAGAEALAT